MTEETEKKQKGYYLTDVATSFAKVIVKDNKQVELGELVIKMANALEEAGIMKE